MDRLREHLRKELGKKVDAHGLVVWDDTPCEYVGVAEDAKPSDAEFTAWEGSWYEVRHRVERALAGDRAPRLVVYAPAKAPDQDPLAEIREAGAEFKLRLPTLLRNELAGELTDARLEQIGRQAATLVEAEAAVAGDSGTDVRLINLIGTSDTSEMVIKLLMGAASDEAISQAGLWEETARFLNDSLGGTSSGAGEQLRRSATRHLVLTELADRLGELPEQFQAAWSAPSADQRRRALHVMESWRRDRSWCGAYAEMASSAQSELSLDSAMQWSDSLADVDTVPLVESLALKEFVERMGAGAAEEAQTLARTRLTSSMWVRERLEAPLEGAQVWEPRWNAATELARLRTELDTNRPPAGPQPISSGGTGARDTGSIRLIAGWSWPSVAWTPRAPSNRWFVRAGDCTSAGSRKSCSASRQRSSETDSRPASSWVRARSTTGT